MASSVEEQSSAGLGFYVFYSRKHCWQDKTVLGFPKELCVEVNPDLVKIIFGEFDADGKQSFYPLVTELEVT